ncbi:molybdate ABC transporter substrate-binding protein [Fundidesulfovibrio agrisoli]|uniref:molybdate ABC transporter substrate-binding protein n=1 Tax=Fundidesulfovibrio agrisoli TaxID=2922717 RepID=UPI001FAC1787|nr:molybdate ABC transporter substrate-binding protein [Fundidesulfovibrio agrisoli]
MKRILTTIALAAMLAMPLIARAGSVTVSGAASLTAAFTEVKEAFEKARPGVTVNTNFAASGVLLSQIESGAPVDVFASADQETMDRAQAKNLIDTASRRNFVANALVLCKPKGGKAAVTSMQSLEDKAVERIGLGNPETVPVGRYTREALTTAGLYEKLTPKLVFGDSVKQVQDYISRGEVDAGFIFATDAKIAAAKIDVVAEIPTKAKVSYPLAIVARSKDNADAKAFVDFVLSPEGQAILAKYGFQKPE